MFQYATYAGPFVKYSTEMKTLWKKMAEKKELIRNTYKN